MKYFCVLGRLPNGQWLARHDGAALGEVEATADSKEEVLTKLSNEIRYRVELCPCTGVTDDYVQLEVREE